MKQRILRCGVACLLGIHTAAQAEAPESTDLRGRIEAGRELLADHLFGLNLSAFGDWQSSYSDAGQQQFGLGAIELDAELELNADLQAAMAVVHDPSGDALTVAFIDYHTFGGRIAPHGRLWAEKGFHVQFGRFDLPFGNDWQFFASTDSVSISRPLTTDFVMEGGANDEGLRVLGNSGTINYNTYWVRGFNNGQLLGGRIGLTPFSDPFSLGVAEGAANAEFALSYFRDTDVHDQRNETGWGADAELRQSGWDSRFEYLMRRKEAQVAGEVSVQRAWHCTVEYDMGEQAVWPSILFARYERAWQTPLQVTAGADARDERVVAGFSTDLGAADIVQWKLEMRHYLKATQDTASQSGMDKSWQVYTQLVVKL